MIPDRRRVLLAAARQLARELQELRLQPLRPRTPRRGDRLVGLVAHAGLYLALAAAVAAFFSAALGHGGWQGWLRVAIGAVLAGEGALLFTNWRGARQLLVARLHRRAPAAVSPLEALRRRLVGPALAVAALVAFGGGLILVGFGVSDLA